MQPKTNVKRNIYVFEIVLAVSTLTTFLFDAYKESFRASYHLSNEVRKVRLGSTAHYSKNENFISNGIFCSKI